MAAINRHQLLTVALVIMKRRRRRRNKKQKLKRRMWIRVSNIDRAITGAYASIFIPTKMYDRRKFLGKFRHSNCT